jgi:hypothetical protein
MEQTDIRSVTIIFAYIKMICSRIYLQLYVIRNTREWRKLHNEELHNLYSSPDIIRIIKPRRMRWAGYVASSADVTYGGAVPPFLQTSSWRVA